MPNPVDYAEQSLGVHKVYDEAATRLNEHAHLTDEIKALNAKIRQVKESITDRESLIVAQEGGNIAGLSKTAAKEHMKAAFDADDEINRLRGLLADAEAERADADATLRHHALGVQMLTARMQELGGLLEFYAAAKRNTTSPQVN